MRRSHARIAGRACPKVAATTGLLLSIFEHGGLNLNTGDGIVIWLAILMGFFFLQMCCEYLRSGKHPGVQKCLREAILKLTAGGPNVSVGIHEECDEASVNRKFTKCNTDRVSAYNNIYRCLQTRCCASVLV